MTLPASDAFLEALHAEAPDPEHAQALRLYGQFVGSWRVENTDHLPDGSTRIAIGEWHFGWVLEGRAIQDVWITPARGSDTHALPPGYQRRCGTTLRMYEPATRSWRIVWTDPLIAFQVNQVGRAENGDIVQHGSTTSGVSMRWSFREITANSFRWIGEISVDGGAIWRPQLEMRATRIT